MQYCNLAVNYCGWKFLRVASFRPSTNSMFLFSSGAINLEPSYGSMLGGAGVVISGDLAYLSEEDELTCIFDGIRVTGVCIDSFKVLCISPMLERTGKVDFQLNVIGHNYTFTGESTFTSCKFLRHCM